MMGFGHEWKHETNDCEQMILFQRLRAMAKPDLHTADGKYTLRSLYFDTHFDKALCDKRNGVNCREKFRIRCCNRDSSLIHLEKSTNAMVCAKNRRHGAPRHKPRQLPGAMPHISGS